MSSWFAQLRRAIVLALAWGLAWAPLGVLAGMILDADGAMDEPWVAVGAYPGFLSALLFTVIAGFTYRGRELADIPLARAAAWGGISGLLLMLPLVFGLLGTPNTAHALWRGRYVIVAAVTLLSAMSAVASVAVARNAKARGSRRAHPA